MSDYYPMIKWAKDLFPLCRSLTGSGTRETLQYFKRLNPELEIHSFDSGQQVFDWTIPKEWEINDAYIEHESGQRFAQFSIHNLHVLNYSTPIDTVMQLEELLPHIYTQPDQPDWIPYVTSYYKERWGFCMAHSQKEQLPAGSYRVFIDSRLFDGQLQLADAVLPGSSKKELFFSSPICHPSMANNELSGPVLLNGLMKYVKERVVDQRFSYRFLLIPETIGSIAYLSRHTDTLKNNVYAGFNLACVGDDRAYSHIQSPYGNTVADAALQSALIGKDNVVTYSYLSRGSDERQFCAPHIELPLAGFCRSKFAEYPEYHTSADDFDVVTQEGFNGAFDVMTSIIDAFEYGLYPIAKCLGEPQLGKRDLYPTVSQKGNHDSVKTRMDYLAYANGRTSVFDIASMTGTPLMVVNEESRILSEHDLVELQSEQTGLA